MPELMNDFQAKHPANEFGVILLGNDGGVIRSGTWSTNAEPLLSHDGMMGSSVLGCSGETHSEAARAVRNYLVTMRKDYVDLGSAPQVLKRIICDLAQKHPEINDRVYFSYVFAPEEPGGSVTHTRQVFDFDRMVAAGANVTADHVLTEKATCSNASIPATDPESPPQGISGLVWTVAATGPSDVYNISGGINFILQNASGIVEVALHVYVDGDESTDYGSGMAFCTGNPNGAAGGSGSFFGVVTGLAAGNHTIQVYAYGTALYGSGVTSLNLSGFAFCQRVF